MTHIKDVESHVRSIFEDLEYWRAKRLEPRIFRLIRKEVFSFYDLLTQAAANGNNLVAFIATPSAKDTHDEELDVDVDSAAERAEELEAMMAEFVSGVMVSESLVRGRVLVDESREEAGVYSENLKFTHRELTGSLEERVSLLENFLEQERTVLNTYLNLLVSKGFISKERLKEILAAPTAPTHENGAKVVARAWIDPQFKAKLLSDDAKGALRDMGFALVKTPKLVVLENTESVHNVIVCTLCSCYPYELLGNPPWWYKHDSYKQSVIENPRRTLEEMFKLTLPEEVEVRVFDSTSDIRYMVLPKRPEGSERMSADELAALVTEYSMIGTDIAKSPTVLQSV